MKNDPDEIRPKVSLDLDGDEFARWYWPVAELQDFCDRLEISRSGRKADLRARVATALNGEDLPIVDDRPRPAKSSFDWAKSALNDDTVITETITFGRNVRGYFKDKIGRRFVCHSDFMDWVRSHPGLTLKDAVTAWLALEARHDDPEFRREIAECNNYLSYLRDIRDAHPKLTHDEAKRCWDQKKIRPAHNGLVIYEATDLRFTN